MLTPPQSREHSWSDSLFLMLKSPALMINSGPAQPREPSSALVWFYKSQAALSMGKGDNGETFRRCSGEGLALRALSALASSIS